MKKEQQKQWQNNSIHNKIHEILSKICFVYTVTFLGKEFWARK